MTTSSCPDPETLRLLLTGAILGSEAEGLERHLLECEQCLAKARHIPASDALVSAIEAQYEFSEDTGLLEQAIARAKQLRAEAETVESIDTNFSGRGVEGSSKIQSSNPSQIEAEIDFLGPPEQTDEIGRIGNYRVLEVLGVGGMGVVFCAEDQSLRRRVALKVMKPAVSASRSAKDRFLREAQAAAAIDHDNIVHIYQVGEDRNVPFIAMQLLRGESLQKRLGRDGRLDQREVVRIGREVAEGLAAAHERGLIHRDIKPDNIWLESGNAPRAKILDFGLVRTTTDDAGLTQCGMLLGTPKYMSPEQAKGETVDHRCDLFSLGSVLYHLISGKEPFEGNSPTAILIAVSQANCRPITDLCPDVHPELAALIRRLHSKDRGARPSSATEVAETLACIERQLDGSREEQIASTEQIELPVAALDQAHESSAAARPSPATSSRRRPIWIGSATLATALAIFAWLYFTGIIFKVETEDGTLTVKVTGENIETSVADLNVSIKNTDTGDSYRIRLDSAEQNKSLKPGSYFILESDSGLRTPTDQFTIHSGETRVLEVFWQPRPESPDTSQAEALVEGLTRIYANEFDSVNINLDNGGGGVLREIHDGRHFVACPPEWRGRWGWPVYTVDDGIIDVTARVEPGGDPAWLVILNANDHSHGITFNVSESRVAVHATIFDPRKGPPHKDYPLPEPIVRGQFHRLQLLVDGNQQQVTAYFDGKLLCPPIKLEGDITPCSLSFGIAHSQRDRTGEVSFERYALYPLRSPDEK